MEKDLTKKNRTKTPPSGSRGTGDSQIRETKNALHYRVQFENLITEISTQFINLGQEEVDSGIQQTLKKITSFAGVERSGVFLIRNSHVENIYEWRAPGVRSYKKLLQNISADLFPWWMKRIRQLENIHLPRVTDLPSRAKAERKLLHTLGIKSLIAVPLVLNGSAVGFLGFDSISREVAWSKDIISLLQIVGQIFVNALERKRADEILKESEKKYRQLIDSSLAGIYITQNHILKFCNKQFTEIFGYARPEELIGINVRQLVVPESWPLVEEEIRLRESGRKASSRYEFRAVGKDGSIFDVEVLGSRIIFEGKLSIQGTMIDITERKKAEQSLKESENKYRALFEGIPVGLYRTTPEGRILDLNPAMVEMLGQAEKDSLLGLNAKSLYLNQRDRERAMAILEREKDLRNFEFQVKRADDKVIWVQDNAHAVFTAKGQVLYHEGSLQDITERKRTEEIVRKRTDQVIRHQSALLDLAKIDLADLDASLRMITEIDARSLGVARVSIWFYNSIHSAIICHDLFLMSSNGHEKGMVLEARKYPRYFRALEESRLLAADDALADPRTREFAKDYLTPNGISSMMDIPLRRNGELIGVVCHEHTGEKREWTLEEQHFAVSIGDMVTLALEASDRKRTEKVNASIFKISNAAISSESLDDLFLSIHRIIEDLMPAKNFYIALYDHTSDTLSFPYFVDEFDSSPDPQKPGRGLTEYVLRTGKPLLASPEVFAELERRGEVESVGPPSIDWLGVPLNIDGRTIGILVVQTYTEGVRYGEEEKNILKFVSDQVAMAIHRKKAEKEVQERERFLTSIFESIQDGISVLDKDYRIIRINPAMEKWYAHAMPVVGKKCYEAYHLRSENCAVCPTRRALENSQSAYEIVPKTGPKGEITGWLDLYSFPLIDRDTGEMKGVIEYVRDITERKAAEDQLQASLREKEVLLREIHHRVKNNMQVISSLLNLQSRHSQDSAVLEMFRESQRRIRSMALVHERLYQSSDLSRIEFSEYLRNLATHLFHSCQVNTSRVRLKMDAEEVYLNINTAIPCGLIVNELISNALKHGFPENRSGEVGVELHRVEGDGYMLRVRDDGVGFPEGLDFRTTETLGLQIVTTLVSQIDGSIQLNRKKGTEFSIRFEEVNYTQRT